MNALRLCCLLLALALMLPAGMAGASAEGAMGRYVEVPLAYPAGEYRGYLSFAQASGVTYAMGMSGDVVYRSADLVNWEQVQTGHDEDLVPLDNQVDQFSVDEDGHLYLSSTNASGESAGTIVERTFGGAAVRVELAQPMLSGTERLIVGALPEGGFVGRSSSAVYRFSPEGALLKTYAIQGVEALAAHGGELAAYSYDHSLITVLDLETGRTLRELVPPATEDLGKIGYDAQGALYFASEDGIYCATPGGTLLTQIVDGRLGTLGKPSADALALLFDADNNPVVAFWDDLVGTIALIAYRFDERVPTEPDTVLSVYTLYERDTLRQCATLYQGEHPETLVEISVGLPEGTAVTRDDAIRSLNTAILAGQGPDVLVLDGLPVRNYIEKGVLADLSQVVQPLIDAGELLPNLAAAYKQTGAIPAVPALAHMPTVWGDVEGLETMRDVVDWAQAHPDVLPFFGTEPDPLIGTFYLSCAPAWFSEDGRLDPARIEAFLEAMKAIRGQWTYEAAVRKTGTDVQAMMKEHGVPPMPWNPYQPGLYGSEESLEESGGLMFLCEGTQAMLPYLLRGPDSASMPNGALLYRKQGGLAPLPGQVEGAFVPSLLMGATRSGANQDQAAQFIAAMLSEAIQSADLGEGFPISVKALDAMQARDHARFGSRAMNLEAGGYYTSEWPDPARRAQLRRMVEALKTPVVPDFTLHQMIVQESKPFFEGAMDAKQAAANVCAKANAYLSE